MQSSRESFDKVYAKVHGNVSNTNHLRIYVVHSRRTKELILLLVYYTRKFNFKYRQVLSWYRWYTRTYLVVLIGYRIFIYGHLAGGRPSNFVLLIYILYQTFIFIVNIFRVECVQLICEQQLLNT